MATTRRLNVCPRAALGVKPYRRTLPELLVASRLAARNVLRRGIRWTDVAIVAVTLITLGLAWPDLMALLP